MTCQGSTLRPHGSTAIRYGLVLLLGLLGCGASAAAGPAGPEPDWPARTPRYFVAVAPDGATIVVGDTLRLVAGHFLPPASGPYTNAWFSLDTAVALVSPDGLVTGKAVGHAQVRVLVTGGNSVASATATVRVR